MNRFANLLVLLVLDGVLACPILAAQNGGPQNPGNAVLPAPTPVQAAGSNGQQSASPFQPYANYVPLSAYPEVPLAKMPQANAIQPLGTQTPSTVGQSTGQANVVNMGQNAAVNPGYSRNQGTQAPWSYNNQVNPAAQAASPQEIQQNQRAQQLQLQYQGVAAFSDPSVQQQLNMSPAQIQKLEAYNNVQAQRFAEMYKSVGYNPIGAQGSYQSLLGQNYYMTKQVLTPQQQRTFSNMTGPPAKFQPHWVPSPKQ